MQIQGFLCELPAAVQVHSAVFIFTDSGAEYEHVSNTLRTNHIDTWNQERGKREFPNILLPF